MMHAFFAVFALLRKFISSIVSLTEVLIYLHNIYVKIETQGRLKPSAHSGGRAAYVKFTLRVLAVVAAKTGADALLATRRDSFRDI